MRHIIITIGRHRGYPYLCLALIIIAFLTTHPFTTFNLRYISSFFGAVAGLICTILLAKRRNSGNYWGLLATLGESSGNFLGKNVGAAAVSIYYFITHLYGIITWQSHQNQQKQVTLRHLTELGFLITLLFIIVACFLNIAMTELVNIANAPYTLMANSFIFALGMVAQLLMILRYAFNWWIWILLNILTIILNSYTLNPIIATQYSIYLFNAFFGLLEWKKGEE